MNKQPVKQHPYTATQYASNMFAVMEEVFIIPPDRAHPRLPLGEYVTECGKHRVTAPDKYEHHYFARYVFPNGRWVSVISGWMFYCSPEAPYEVRIGDDEPIGYVNDERLMFLLIQEMLK